VLSPFLPDALPLVCPIGYVCMRTRSATASTRRTYARPAVSRAASKLAAEPPVIGSGNPTLDGPLRIDTVGRDGSLVLKVHGELDIATSPLLDEALARARDTGAASIVVDLSSVSFMDSTGLHVLIKHAREEDNRSRLRLTKPSAQARRLFELSGAYAYLPFVSE
jgi:anti-sigma B factor antagonist